MLKIKNLVQKIDKYFFLIVLLAVALRFYDLSSYPPSLNWDEVSHGYNAYSILETGRDEWGNFMPTIFKAYGDYKLPVYIYITAISEKLFGLTEFAVRLPSVLAGVGTVIFTYLLAYKLFKKKNIARLSAFLVAVEPWSLFLSRAAFEANLALFFIVSGVYFFIRSLEKPKSLVFSSILLGLSVWTYNSARIFVPLLMVALILIYWKDFRSTLGKNLKPIIISAIMAAIFMIPMFIQLMQPSGQARYQKVAIIDIGAINSINESRGASSLNPTFNRMVNNKVTYFVKHFAANWVAQVSPTFLFVEGGSDYQFSVPGRGILFVVDAIPIAIALIWLLVKRSKSGALLLSWLILSPIPAAITNEAPHVLRAIVMLPVPMILSAVGIYEISSWLKTRLHISRNAVVAIYVVVILGFLENYLMSYFLEYRSKYSWSWQYGYKEAVAYAQANYSNYDKIVISKKYGEPHEFFLFYLKYNPNNYQHDPKAVRFFQSDWYWVDRFDKYNFVNDWQIKTNPLIMSSIQQKFVMESGTLVNCSGVKCLLITSPDNAPAGWKKLNSINFLDGKPAFEMYDNI